MFKFAFIMIGLLGATLCWADTGKANSESSVAMATSLPLLLKSKLNSLGVPESAISLMVNQIDSGQTLVSVNADTPRNPASVMKMVTTYAALSQLGPGYQWETEVRRTGLVKNGVLQGDLILVGHGDPMFVKSDLWELVNHLNSRGIRSVAGDLIIDSGYFDLPDHDPNAFDGRQYRPYNAGPDAVLFNFNTVDFTLVPISKTNKIDVRVIPPVEGMTVVSNINQTGSKCSGSNISLHMKVGAVKDGKRVEFSGKYPGSCGRYTLTRAVHDNHELLYGTLKTLFEEKGGKLAGDLLRGAAPEESTRLFTMPSETLSEVIRSTNKFSNNVMSRQVFLTLGSQVKGAPSSIEKSKASVHQVLQDQGIETDSLIISNGSGLCRECRVNVSMLSELLDRAWHSQYMPEFMSSLGVTGIDGSLKRRFKRDYYKGRIHMKTGTIDHVTAMAGMVHSKSGKRYSFVVILNHRNVHKGKGLAFQRNVMKWLVDL